MEQEAVAAWKKVDEMNINLNSKFMDFEDVWKANLGQDLYKERANNLGVDA